MTIKTILRQLNMPVRSGAQSREVEDELRHHIEMRTRDNIAAGMTPEDAAADAARRFGDFDQLAAICEQIKDERFAGMLKIYKGIIWLMLGCGLTLILSANVDTLRSVGVWLILIAILLRLLVHLRETEPDQHRIRAAGRLSLSVIHPINRFPSEGLAEGHFTPDSVYDLQGRTPIERVISGENIGEDVK